MINCNRAPLAVCLTVLVGGCTPTRHREEESFRLLLYSIQHQAESTTQRCPVRSTVEVCYCPQNVFNRAPGNDSCIQSIASAFRAADSNIVKLQLALCLARMNSAGRAALDEILESEREEQARAYTFVAACWSRKLSGASSLPAIHGELPPFYGALGKAILGDAECAQVVSVNLRHRIQSFVGQQGRRRVGIIDPASLRDNLPELPDYAHDRIHRLLTDVVLWSLVGTADCLNEIIEAAEVDDTDCASYHTAGPNIDAAYYLLSQLLEIPSSIDEAHRHLSKWLLEWWNCTQGLLEWNDRTRKYVLVRTDESEVIRSLNAYLWTTPLVEDAERQFGSNRLDRLNTAAFDPVLRRIVSKDPRAVLKRAHHARLTSWVRAEYVLMVGGLRGADLEIDLRALVGGLDPMVVGEAIRALALLETACEPILDARISDTPEVKSAMSFFRAMRGGKAGRERFLDEMRREIGERQRRAIWMRPLYRDLVSLLQLSDIRGVEALVEAVRCKDNSTEYAALELLDTRVLLPGGESCVMEGEWRHRPALAYDHIRAKLKGGEILVRWDADAGKYVLSLK